jgi:hypothetical protein
VPKARNDNLGAERGSKQHTRQQLCVVRRHRVRLASYPASLSTLTVLIPRSYNVSGRGARLSVEHAKVSATVKEIKQYFSGYTCKSVAGWQRDKRNPEGCNDNHWSFEIDTPLSPELIAFLQNWKRKLQRRFRQREIFMRLSSQVTWL